MEMKEILDKMKSLGVATAAAVNGEVETADDAISSMKLNARRLKQAREEYDRQRNELDNEKERIKGKLSKKCNEVMKGDLKELHGLMLAAKSLHEQLGSGKGDEIYKVFKAIFQNMCAKTIDVHPHKDYNNPGVTVGKFGFGLKHNKVSRKVESVGGMMTVVKFATEISAELRKYHHMIKWAVKLDLFVSLLPGEWIFKSHDARLELQQPVLIPSYSDFEIGKFVKLAYNTGYQNDVRSFLMLEYDDGREPDKRRVQEFQLELSKNDLSWDTSIVWLQLRDELLQRKDELIALVDSQVTTANEAVGKLKSTFMKDIMLNDV